MIKDEKIIKIINHGGIENKFTVYEIYDTRTGRITHIVQNEFDSYSKGQITELKNLHKFYSEYKPYGS